MFPCNMPAASVAAFPLSLIFASRSSFWWDSSCARFADNSSFALVMASPFALIFLLASFSNPSMSSAFSVIAWKFPVDVSVLL